MRRVRQAENYHIYNKENNGGVVIADANGDIVGYTDHGSWDDVCHNDVFNEILHCLDRAARICKKMPTRGNAASKLRTALLAETSHNFKPSVKPLLKNLWSQYEAPYDLLAPKVDGQPCEAGCVALAMAQVMHYWQYPEHGYGSYTYHDSLGCKQMLTADFSAHYYDWDNMLGNYEGVDYTDAQAFAVAQLLYDCGVAVDMRYGVEASGARVVRQPIAMTKYFGYDRSCQMHYRDFYTLDEWTAMFKQELSEGRPILMSGLSNKYNHAFVCDGYDERGFFHFSFGNVNGAADGFFYLPYLTPDIPPEMNPEEAEGGFNILQSMTTRIMPATHPDATGVESHLFALSGMDVVGKDTCVVHNLGNIGWNQHGDSVSLALLSGDRIVAFPYTYKRNFLLEEIDDTTYTDTMRIVLDKPLSDGTYKLMPMYRSNGEWESARTSVGTPNYLIANVKDNDVTLHADDANAAYLTLESVDFPQWLPTRCTPDYTVRLTCHNADLCGRVYVVLENVIDSLPSVVMQRQGVTLSAGETATLHYYHTPRTVPEGIYYLRIYYDHDLFSADEIMLDGLEQTVCVTDHPEAIGQPAAQPPLSTSKIYGVNGLPMPDANAYSGIFIRDGKKWVTR